MTIRRGVWWLAGMAVVVACMASLRLEPRSTWVDVSPAVWWLDVMAAAALVTAAVLVERLGVPAVTWVAGTMWLLPDLAGVRQLEPGLAALFDAMAWVLPALIVLTLMTASGQALAGRSMALLMAGCVVGVLGRLFAANPFLELDCWRTCRGNPLAIGAAAPVAAWVAWVAALLLAAGLVSVLVDRRGLGTGAPAVLASASAGALVVQAALPNAGPHLGWAVLAHVVGALSAVLLSIWLLADELASVVLRRRLAALAVDLGRAPAPGRFAQSFRATLHDPQLQVGYWIQERGIFVDGEGVALPPPRGYERHITTVTRSGQRLAVLVHSRAADPRTVTRALGPALRLALENDQLRAAQLFELRDVDDSRRRILERAHEERRRLERNLHDGVQQRVVLLLLTLRMMKGRVRGEDAAAVDAAMGLAGRLLDELRRLARGIHPAVVADAGLAGALGDLAEHSTDVPVSVRVHAAHGLSEVAESTAYEFVATALADARSGAATHVDVRSTDRADLVVVRVHHDGMQSPDSVDLDGVAVQAEALAGSIRVDGSPGDWSLTMELPCGS